MPPSASDIEAALAALNHPTPLPAPTPSETGTLVTLGMHGMQKQGGAEPIKSGSIANRELPLPLPAPLPPSPALPPSVLRARRVGAQGGLPASRPKQGVVRGGGAVAPPSPYGSSPAVHPDTGAPLAQSIKGGRRPAPAWATTVNRPSVKGMGGDATPRNGAVMALAGRLKAYATRRQTIAA